MFVNHFLFCIISNICYSNAAVFLWSNRQIRISPLQPFTTKEFSKIIDELENPEIHIFKSPSALSENIKLLTRGFYTAFNPNGYINLENVTDLSGDGELDVDKVQEVMTHTKSGNVISVIVIPDKETRRFKREDDNSTTASPEPEKTTQPAIPQGSVIYKAQNANNKLFALLYSSKPLLLKRNNSELYLGNTDHDMIIYDNRLNINIPVGKGKISLRFSFVSLNGYWYMPSVKITETDPSRDYNLTTDEDIMAPINFSYHCNGHSVYSDGNGTELYIYDIQVQMDSTDGKFGDANDCVPFTTAPIWSGLLVTTLFGIGLIVALTAIMDIKTMDKFDNHNTKNLAITVSE